MDADVTGGRERLWEEMRPWLVGPADDNTQLIRWLQGYDLPPVGDGDEPYLWLLRSLPADGDRGAAERALAGHLARLLDTQPDVNLPGRWPRRLLYNALTMAAALGIPAILSESLIAMFERRVLAGEWQGVQLSGALRSALIYNQRDQRLKTDWQRMLDHGCHEYLLGDAYSGLEGILNMPGANPGTVDGDALGSGLKRIAERLKRVDPTPRRGQMVTAFRRLLDHVDQTVPHAFSDLDLVKLADQHEWPDWTIEALPRLCFRLVLGNGKLSFGCWRPLATIFDATGKSTHESSFCREGVQIIAIPRETVDRLSLEAWVNGITQEVQNKLYRNTLVTAKSSMNLVRMEIDDYRTRITGPNEVSNKELGDICRGASALINYDLKVPVST